MRISNLYTAVSTVYSDIFTILGCYRSKTLVQVEHYIRYLEASQILRIAGIAQWCSAGLRAGWPGVRVGVWNFSLHHGVRGLWGPPSLPSNGYQGFYPWG
jgi:hypothetical protein